MRRTVTEKNYTPRKGNARTQAACLDAIYKTVDVEGLSDEVMKRLGRQVHAVSRHFGIGSYAAVLLAAILEKSYANHNMDDEDLAQYVGCSNIEFIQYHADLREMTRAGVIQEYKSNRRFYRITPEAVKSIETESAFTPVKMTGLTPDEFFQRMRAQFHRFRHDEVDAEDLLGELDVLVRNNEQLLFCEKVLASPVLSNCRDTEKRMFLYLCHRYVVHGETSVEVRILMNFTEMFENDESLRRALDQGHMDIQRGGLVCFPTEDGLVDTERLALTDGVRNTFFEGVTLTPPRAFQHSDVVPCGSIRPKELYFNEKELTQIERLAGLLEQDNFVQVQERLAASGMRKGFNAIFYGGPGTGKTACVYELARRTGRDVFCVDMSKLRDKYVGESEKSVKGVFHIYRRLCRGSERVPILLFNEADAVFARRFERVEDSVDQMNNTMQNIILQEMENLDGILIATTNLEKNLDAAFERRFIFKVEFRLPEQASRARIWRSMIPDLTEDEAGILAERYAFSGGNIENIARKSSVEYILSGRRPALDLLESFCEEENLQKGVRRAGFRA